MESMRGPETSTEDIFTMRRPDDLVPAKYPLRRIGVISQVRKADIGELPLLADMSSTRETCPSRALRRANSTLEGGRRLPRVTMLRAIHERCFADEIRQMDLEANTSK
jgi:hypothetical protein